MYVDLRLNLANRFVYTGSEGRGRSTALPAEQPSSSTALRSFRTPPYLSTLPICTSITIVLFYNTNKVETWRQGLFAQGGVELIRKAPFLHTLSQQNKSTYFVFTTPALSNTWRSEISRSQQSRCLAGAHTYARRRQKSRMEGPGMKAIQRGLHPSATSLCQCTTAHSKLSIPIDTTAKSQPSNPLARMILPMLASGSPMYQSLTCPALRNPLSGQ